MSKSKKMVALCLAFLMIFNLVMIQSATATTTPYSHTITLDGNNDFYGNATTERWKNETFATSSDGMLSYITWDQDHIYLAYLSDDIRGNQSDAASKWLLAYFGGTGGTKTGVNYAGQQPSLPFDAKFHLRFKVDGSYTNLQTWSGTSWQNVKNYSWGSNVARNDSNKFIEFKIPKADIGLTNASTLQYVSTLAFEHAADFDSMWASVPSGSFANGNGRDRDFSSFYEFDLNSLNTAAAAQIYSYDFKDTSASHSTANFSLRAMSGATAIAVQQSTDGGATWSVSNISEATPLTQTSSNVEVTGLTPDTAYKFRLVTTGGAFVGSSAIVNLKTSAAPLVDTIAPTAPISYNITNLKHNSLTLSWAASTDNVAVTKYEISQDGAKIAEVTGDKISYAITGLNALTSYSFTVAALDAAGNKSAPGETVDITTTAAPVNNNVTIWYKKGFATPHVHYSPEGGAWTTAPGTVIPASEIDGYNKIVIDIGTADKITAVFNDGGLNWDNNDSKNYVFNAGVSTFIPGANGAPGTITAGAPAVDTEAPSAPTGLVQSELTQSGFKVTWTASTDNVAVTGYEIYRNDAKVGTVAGDVTTFTLTALTPETTYSITVKAVDAKGNVSAASSVLSVTTAAAPPSNKVTIWYKKGFATPYVHYSPESGVWTLAPGLAIPVSEIDGYNKIVIDIGTADKITAVFNDGGLNWDNNDSKNYVFNAGVSTFTPGAEGAPGTITAGAPVVDTEAPSAPTGLVQSELTHSGFKVTWSASTDNVAVTGYEIYRNDTKIGTVAGDVTTFTLAALPPETTYSITVKAVDAKGNVSAASSALSVTTATAPPSNKVTIWYKKGFATPYVHYSPEGGAWTTAPGLAIPASEIDGYNKIVIDIGTADKITAVFNDGGVNWDNNDSKNYVFNAGVSTFTPGAEGAPGTITSGEPVIADVESPSVPTTLTSTDITETGFTVSWTASIDNIGVTGYEVYLNNVLITTVTGLSYSFTGLTDGTAYSVTVKAIDDAGNKSESSDPISVTTIEIDDVAPSVPQTLNSSSVTANSLVLNWTASTDNVAVTSYEIFQGAESIGTSTTTTFNVTSLTSGLNYTFTVIAFDAAGNKSASSIAHSVRTVDNVAPTAPQNVVAANISGSGFRITWTASTDNVGVSSYNVYRNGAFAGTVTGTSFLFSGLTVATTYNITVLAQDAAKNRSPLSTPLAVTTLASLIDTTAPSVPIGLNATNVAVTSFTLNWTASTDNVGVTKYEVYRGTTFLGSPTTTSFNVTSLVSNTRYTMTVLAVDAAGNKSAVSTALSVTTLPFVGTDITPPNVPTGLVSRNITETGFTVAWQAATDNAGVTSYNVYNGGKYVTTVSITSYTFSGLIAGTTYSITVMALDAAKNRSPLSAPLSVKTTGTTPVLDTTAPTAPTNLVSSAVSTTGFTVSWTASTDNVGVTGYNVYRDGKYVATTTRLTYTFSGLLANTTYSITVLAMDAAKNRSVLSAPLSVKTNLVAPDSIAPTAPTGLVSSNITTTSFVVSWTPATDNIGVTDYNVYRNGTYLATIKTTTYTFTGLVSNTAYNITVLALDAARNRSPLSAPLSVKTN